MDTSKEYILMCEKAEEIQKEWRKSPEPMDMYCIIGIMLSDIYYYTWDSFVNRHFSGRGKSRFYQEGEIGESICFLPRQDQL
jgi:hypothetical protein